MRAAVNTRYGSPDVVSITEVPIPQPAIGELLIRVDVTTVNRTDCEGRFGAHAEYLVVNQHSSVAAVPDNWRRWVPT